LHLDINYKLEGVRKIMREYWEQIGYKPLTTLWEDFSIADRFIGVEKNPIEDTYKRALDFAKGNYKYLTELVLVLNHKIWQWYEKNATLGIIYDTLWRMAESKFFELYEDNSEAMEYYYRVTD
jgi:hypothetical protein